MKKKASKKVAYLAAKASRRIAEHSSNTCCQFFVYQQPLPEKVKKLRKF